jgi:hypothetical protein
MTNQDPKKGRERGTRFDGRCQQVNIEVIPDIADSRKVAQPSDLS